MSQAVISPSASVSETERLAVLDELRALELDQSPSLRRICEIAGEVFGVPGAYVSILDRDTQWLKASVGLEAIATAREGSFCDHTIRGDGVMVVTDAAADPRFASSPLVREGPMARFYAGAPLVVEPGVRLGALCVIGPEPRQVSDVEASILKRLAETASAELRRHKADLDAETARADLDRVLDERARSNESLRRQAQLLERSETFATSGSWECDLATGELRWSDGLYRLLGFEPGCGREPAELFRERVHPEDLHLLDEAVAAVERIEPFAFDIRVVRPDGGVRCLSSRGEPIGPADGGPRRMMGVLFDVTRERETESALRESEDHHRHAVELSPQIPWTADGDGNILEAGRVGPRSPE